MAGLIIFDGDDTLWKTQELYDAAKHYFANLMRREGFVSDSIIELLDRIDAEQVLTQGFTHRRFVNSMLLTYERLCAAEGKCLSQGQVEHLRQIAPAFLSSSELYEDAIPVLRRLGQYFRLALATKGEPEVQSRKLDATGLRPYFERVYVIPRKTEREHAAILRDFDTPPERAWAVGNSAKSDINPALRLGMKAVLISRGVWRYEAEQLGSGDVTIAHSLTEAAEAILRGDGIVAPAAGGVPEGAAVPPPVTTA